MIIPVKTKLRKPAKEERNILEDHIHGLKELLELISHCSTPAALLAELRGTVLRNHPSKTLVKIDLGDTSYYLKVWWDCNFVRYVKNLYRGDRRAIREARGLLLLNENGFTTPKLIAYGYVTYDWLDAHSYILTEELKQSQTLESHLRCAQNEEILKCLAGCLHVMHQGDIVFGDLHARNVLVLGDDDKPQFYFVDPMGVKKSRRLNKKLADVVNFLYYTKQGHGDRRDKSGTILLRTYYDLYVQARKAYREYTFLERTIYKRLDRKRRWRRIYRVLIDLG